MFVCLSVGKWKVNGNPNPCTDRDEILHAYPHLFRKGFGAGLIPAASPPGPGGPKTLKAGGLIFENKRCSAGCELTWAAPGTSAS